MPSQTNNNLQHALPSGGHHHQPPQPMDSFKVYNQQRQQQQQPLIQQQQTQQQSMNNMGMHFNEQQQNLQQQQIGSGFGNQQLPSQLLSHQSASQGIGGNLQQQQNFFQNNSNQLQQQQQFNGVGLQNQQQLNNQVAPTQQFQAQHQQIAQNQNIAPPAQQNMFGNEEQDQGDIIGVIKIKDGIFICDEYGAQDLEFVAANKVTRVVNTAGTQLPNHWEPIGVLYLTLNWQDDEKQTLFDSQEKIPDEIYKFMEEAIDNQESVLVQSCKAQNRACFVIAAFIMRRYRWSLLKTLEFLNSRRPDLEMRSSFLSQLSQYENKLHQRGMGPKTQRWTELSDNNIHLENEELILRNTYLNSQMAPLADLSQVNIDIEKNFTLKWVDETAINKRPLAEEGPDEEDLVNLINPPPIMHHREQRHFKPIVKGSRLKIAQSQQNLHNQQQNNQILNVPKSRFLAKTSTVQGQPLQTNFQQQQQQPPVAQINFHPVQQQQQQLHSNVQSNSNNHLQKQQENLTMINPQPSKFMMGNSNGVAQQQQQNHQPLQDQSNFVNYQAQVNNLEPKKRELTQKIPQKNTVNDDKSNINISSMSTQLENMGQNNENQNILKVQNQNTLQQPIQNLHQQKLPPSHPQHQTVLSQQNINLNSSHQKIRGISPSVQSKQQSLHEINSSAKKRQSAGGNQVLHTSSGLDNMKRAPLQVSKYTPTSGSLSGLNTQQRPGSVPKRPQTPTQQISGNSSSTQQSSTQNSFIMKTNQSTVMMNNNNSQSNFGHQKQDQNSLGTTQQTNQSKNMLNSFRNGPIKIMNSNTATSIGGGLLNQNTTNQRIQSATGGSSNTILHSGASNLAKLGPNKTGQPRPSSAPNKRPSSPSQNGNSSLTSTTGATQNRVKYNPSQNSTVTRSAVFKQGQSLLTTGGSNQSNTQVSGNPPNQANGLKPGLNPTLRGYSPSKLRWKQQTGQTQQSSFGQSNPNTFTRSTKHIPSYK